MDIQNWISKNINQAHFKGKNAFITGGNSGIGFELVKHVLSLGSNVFLLCRNKEKTEKVIADLLVEFPGSKINFIELDLASFDSIKRASEVIKKYDVDMFINNAGVYHISKGLTKDGIESVMGTNYIGTLYLSSLILPYLATLPHKVHMIYESSLASNMSHIDYDDFFMNKKYSQMKIYARSKVAVNSIFFHYLDEYKDSNIIFSLTHPGIAYTPLVNKAYHSKGFQALAKHVMKVVFHSAKKASLTLLYALNEQNSVMVGPRGIFEIKGYPKETKLRKDKKSEECIKYAFDIIREREVK